MALTSGNLFYPDDWNYGGPGGGALARELSKADGTNVATYTLWPEGVIVQREFAWLPNGRLGILDGDTDTLRIYDRDLALVTVTGSYGPANVHRLGTGIDGKFYVYRSNSGTTRFLKRYAADGTLEFTSSNITLATSSVANGIGSNAAGTVIYYADRLGANIRKWDAIGNSYIGVLLTTGADSIESMYQLPDGSFIIVETYADPTTYKVSRYLEDGTLVGSYDTGYSLNLGGGTNKFNIAPDPSTAAHFWVGVARNDYITDYNKVSASSLTSLLSFTFDWSNGLGIEPSYFSIVPARAVTPTTPPTPTIVTSTPCCGAGAGGGASTGPVPTPVSKSWTPQCAGAGTIPPPLD